MRRAATAARALTRQTFTAARQVSAPHLAACTTASVRRSFSEGPPAPADEARLSETFLSGTAAQYLEELYLDWTEDPSSVHPSWNAYFKGLAAGAPPGPEGSERWPAASTSTAPCCSFIPPCTMFQLHTSHAIDH